MPTSARLLLGELGNRDSVVHARTRRTGDRLAVGDEMPAPALAKLLAGPRARSLRAIDACGVHGAPRAISRATGLVGLRELDVSQADLGDAGLVELAAAPQLRGLEKLDVTWNPISARGVRALCAPGVFPALRWLRIDCAGLARGLDPLLASELAAHLSTLELPLGRLGDAHAAAIARARSLAKLERLSLAATKVGRAGIAALAASRTLTSLVALDLAHTRLLDAGVAPLARARFLPRLTWLSLRATQVSPKAVAHALARAGALRALDLSALPLTDATFPALAPVLRRLERLNLDWCSLGPGAATVLARCATLDTLILSDPIDGGGLGDAGAAILAGARPLATLRVLDLRANAIGEAGARALARSRHLGRLEHLELRWNHIPPAAAKLLVARFGTRVSLRPQRRA